MIKKLQFILLFIFLLALPALGVANDNADAGGDDEFFDLLDEQEEEEDEVSIADPLEPLNRGIFYFNDKLYFWVLKPTSQVYAGILSEELRIAVKNFFHNLVMPVRLASSLLQGKFKRAGMEVGRFSVNTVFGAFGLFDVANEHLEWKREDEDLGQTLGYYGVGEGFYIVLPFFGPSSARDAIGLVGDHFLSPPTYLPWSFEEKTGLRAGETVNNTSLRVGEYEDIKEDALDPYIAVRNIYIQYRQEKVRK